MIGWGDVTDELAVYSATADPLAVFAAVLAITTAPLAALVTDILAVWAGVQVYEPEQVPHTGNYLTDDAGNILTDENGNRLTL